MKKTLEELVQKLQQSDKDRPFFKELDQIPPFDVIKDDKGRTFWTDYYKEVYAPLSPCLCSCYRYQYRTASKICSVVMAYENTMLLQRVFLDGSTR